MSRRMSLPSTPLSTDGANNYSEFNRQTEGVVELEKNKLKSIFDRSRRSSLFPIQESKFLKGFSGFRVPRTPGRHFLRQ